jgi:hypothetical protein
LEDLIFNNYFIFIILDIIFRVFSIKFCVFFISFINYSLKIIKLFVKIEKYFKEKGILNLIVNNEMVKKYVEQGDILYSSSELENIIIN